MSQSAERPELRAKFSRSGSLDVIDTYSPLYTRATTYADEARPIGDFVEVRYRVLPEQCDPRIRQMLRGIYGIRQEDGAITNRLKVNGHTDGHLLVVPLFPGWQGKQAVLEAAQRDEDYFVREFPLTRFSRPIFPGNEVEAAAAVVERRGDALVINGETKRDNETMWHTQVNGMLLLPVGGRHPQGVLLYGQILEHQAQAVGATHILREGSLPEGHIIIYIGIWEGKYEPIYVEPHDTLISNTKFVSKDQRSRTYHVSTRKGDDEIASGRVRIGFAPLAEIQKMYEEQPAA